ncbi:MAG TPA: urease accessory UreF family protein [Ohtaekwangia sp.]|uniref:urease accessory protein UreF n=1 Tax=Ohtaekwangia sp. TaxID=2066019 RepID=UPI002F945A34
MTLQLRLLHLADSAVPVGSFAYSFGLESAVNAQAINDVNELANYLYAFLQQTTRFELPFVKDVFKAEDTTETIARLVEEYDAMQFIPSMRKASITQGRNWMKVLMSFYPDASLHDIDGLFQERSLPSHVTILLALSLKKIGYNFQDVASLILHFALRDQLSAAIRLGVIGPMEAHQLQHKFYTILDDLLLQVPDDASQAFRSAFMLDIFQMNHQHIYSKLFQN